MKERILTCIICPRGCSLRVELDGRGAPVKVEGNACPRGEKYAVTECTAPTRTVTSTVVCKGGGVVPVKTDRAVPKGKIFDVMKEIAKVRADDGAPIGSAVIENVADTGARVIITGKVSK